MTTAEVILYSAAAAILAPLLIYSFLNGSPSPESGPLAKYYRAEKHLALVGNLFLLALTAVAIGKLGLHFGIIDASLGDRVDLWTSVPFLVLLLLFGGMLIRAVLKVRRAGPAD